MIYLFLCLYVFVEFVIQKEKQTKVEDKWSFKLVSKYALIQVLGSLLFLFWFIPTSFDIYLIIGLAIALKVVFVTLRLFIDSKITKFKAYKACETDDEKNLFIQKYIKIRYIAYHIINVYFTLAIWSEIRYANGDVKRSVIDSAVDGQTSLYILIFILLTIVANQVFKVYFSQYSMKKDSDEGNVKAGSLIGSMERIAMMILLIAGQWIGLTIVIAAKSIARFKQLEDKKFSEYYLIGTLFSIIFVIITYYVLIQSIFS